MAKTVRIADANLMGKGTLELSDSIPIDKLARMSQIAQGDQAVSRGFVG